MSELLLGTGPDHFNDLLSKLNREHERVISALRAEIADLRGQINSTEDHRNASGPLPIPVPLASIPTPHSEDLDPTDFPELVEQKGDDANGHTRVQDFGMSVLSRNFEAVQILLQCGADPNQQITDFRCNGKSFLWGTPLSIAVLNADMSMISLLLSYGADINSEYSFLAGMAQIEWRGQAVHATIPPGRLELLRFLVESEADLQRRGSNGANVLWQAAHFGQVEIARFLIEMRCDLEATGVSQDDLTITYTPLHKAVHAGHLAVVQELLDARANVEGQPAREACRPLQDAIISGHGDVVKALVSHGASLYSDCNFDGTATDLICNMPVLNTLLDSGNVVAVAAVAQGLQHGPIKQIEMLTGTDVVRFLSCHGSASRDILRAIVRPQKIQFWDHNKRRTVLTNASINTEQGINVCEGPHPRVLEDFFLRKQPLTEDLTNEFLQVLLPQDSNHHSTDAFVPVHVFVCHVPSPHTDLKILWALAETRNQRLFSDDLCVAVVQMNWHQVKGSAKLLTAFEILYLCLTVGVNYFSLDNPFSPVVLDVVTWACFIVWVAEQLLEVAILVGYVSWGDWKHYVKNPMNWAGQLRALLNGWVLIFLIKEGTAAKELPLFNFIQGVTIFIRWMKVLYKLRAFKSIGTRILPIMTTMWDVTPFCGVLFMYMAGSVNAYYALDRQPMSRALFLMYEIVVAQDVDEWAMENRYPESTLQPDGTIVTDYSFTPGPYYWYVQGVIIFTSFVLGISMMNIFIAILSFSYQKAMSSAWESFLRERAWIATHTYITKHGFQVLCCCRRKQKTIDSRSEAKTAVSTDIAETGVYLWYSVPTVDEFREID